MNPDGEKKPWKQQNPKPKSARTKLTPASIAKAKAAAKKAGRRYPNMVDNMNAAKAQNAAAQRKSTQAKP